MGLFITVITDSVHFLKYIVFCDLYLVLNKDENKYKSFISFFLIALVSTYIYFSKNAFINLISYFIVVLCGLKIIYYKEKMSRLIVSCIWILFLLEILDIISRNLLSGIFVILKYNNEYLLNLGTSIISLIIVYLIGIIIKSHNKNGLKNIKTYNIVAITLLAAIEAFVLMLLETRIVNQYVSIHIIAYEIAYVFMVIGVFIQLAAVIVLMVSRNTYREKEEIATKFLNEQVEHYKYLELRERETRKFRHDLKSHMYMLKSFYETKNYEHFDEYFDVINAHVDRLGNKISVNNDIVDAVLNRYYTETQASGIQMTVKGHFPRECNISAYDLCTIFSNLLSNAVEASREAEKKEIEVSCMFRDEKEIIVIISNYYKEITKDAKGKLVTKKRNKELHGIGLENIMEHVEKNNGYINISDENNQFIVTVVLKR